MLKFIHVVTSVLSCVTEVCDWVSVIIVDISVCPVMQHNSCDECVAAANE